MKQGDESSGLPFCVSDPAKNSFFLCIQGPTYEPANCSWNVFFSVRVLKFRNIGKTDDANLGSCLSWVPISQGEEWEDLREIAEPWTSLGWFSKSKERSQSSDLSRAPRFVDGLYQCRCAGKSAYGRESGSAIPFIVDFFGLVLSEIHWIIIASLSKINVSLLPLLKCLWRRHFLAVIHISRWSMGPKDAARMGRCGCRCRTCTSQWRWRWGRARRKVEDEPKWIKIPSHPILLVGW